MHKWLLILLLIVVSSFALTQKEVQEAYHRSYTYEKLGDFENAIRTLMPVLDAFPTGYTINLRLGWLYYNNTNLANSIHHYQQAIKTAPNAIDAKLGYIYPLLAKQNYSEVESICYQIISVDYHNYYANLKLAYVLRLQSKLDLAEKVVQKMLYLYPVDVSFLSEFGLLKAAGGDQAVAAATFWDIITLDPENITAKNYFQQN